MSPFIRNQTLQIAIKPIAKSLNIINIFILTLSLLLLTLGMSASNKHSDKNVELLVGINESEYALVEPHEKRLADNRIWSVKPAFGGGIIVTDTTGLIRNKISDQHYRTVINIQWLLLALLVFAFIAIVVIVASAHYFRLAATSLLLIITSLTLKIPVLFSMGYNVDTATSSAIAVFAAFSLCYWVINKKLLKDNYTSDSLIAYASQSGSAMSLAKRFKKALMHNVDVRCISTLTPACLTQYNEVLLIASTYGDGEPPEKAQRFVHKLEAQKNYSTPVKFSVLALGDRQYPGFCAFGHQLSKLLSAKGARPLTDVVEVDKLDPTAINHWWQKITALCEWRTGDVKQQYFSLEVHKNTCLNPSQTHRHGHVLRLDKQQLDYQPGDLLEIVPEQDVTRCNQWLSEMELRPEQSVTINDKTTSLLDAVKRLEWHGEQAADAQQLVDQLKPLSTRVYSIVSAPDQPFIEIFVRRQKQTNGRPGVASNYLCDVDVGQIVEANIRTHTNFHLPKIDVPLILIGAGTGIAPLIGFLRHRAALGSTQEHWLLFGEQHQQSDFYFADEIRELQQQRILTELSLAWSRDDDSSYLDEHIKKRRDDLLEWIYDKDAHIYICGSQAGFGKSVCTALSDMVGQTRYERMIEEGVLRTDLY